jgi:hypothetical protein
LAGPQSACLNYIGIRASRDMNWVKPGTSAYIFLH